MANTSHSRSHHGTIYRIIEQIIFANLPPVDFRFRKLILHCEHRQQSVHVCGIDWVFGGIFVLIVHANSTIHRWTWFNHGPSFRVLWIEEAENFYYKSEEKWLMKRNSFFLASMFHQIIDIFLCTFFTFCLKVTRRLTSPMAGGYWKETWKFCFSRLTHILPNESIHCY